MGHKYRRHQQDFYLFGAENEISETQYGIGAFGNVYYPNVSSCTTMTLLLDDNSVLGTHLAKADTIEDLTAIIAELNAIRGDRAVTGLYMLGALSVRGNGFTTTREYCWPQQLTTFNRDFGRPGGAVVRGFNQGDSTDLHYRGQRAGDTMLWFNKSQRIALKSGDWEPVALSDF